MTKKQRENSVKLLTEAQGLIQTGWARNADAVNSSGEEVDPCTQGAKRFCAGGSLIRAEHNLKLKKSKCRQLVTEVLDSLAREQNEQGIVNFNDNQKSKKPVVKIFQKAIDQLNAF